MKKDKPENNKPNANILEQFKVYAKNRAIEKIPREKLERRIELESGKLSGRGYQKNKDK